MLGLLLALGFVLFTIIGTLTHELGHIAFAKAQGFDTSLHYGYMNYDNPIPEDIQQIANKYKEALSQGLDFPEKERWEEVRAKRKTQSRWVTFGGPFQTVLFGTIGCFLLYRRRERILKFGMTFLDWVLVFLSLFWLRAWYNPVFSFVKAILKGSLNPFTGRSDELNLARSLGWWEGSISLPLAVLAVLIAMYVVLKILPKTYRLTFILAGFGGGVFGFFFWLEWVGPIVMP